MAWFSRLSFLNKQFILLALSYWICTVKGENKSFVTISTTSSANSVHVIGAAKQPAGSPSTPSDNNNGKDSNNVPEKDFPTWIAVIVSLVVGFVVVSCCICAVRIRRWRKDQGSYSMWNEHERQPNAESLYGRESGVLFEQLELDSSLTEDKCYEIPVDSFITPQRIYIDGIRVTPVKEGLEDSLKSNEQCMSESANRMAAVNKNEYYAVTDRISRTSDVTGRKESMTNSSCGDSSKHSSESSPTDTPADFPAAVESPAKETYCKPLPVIDADEAVTCETYNLSKPNQDRVSALLNRPLPRTPMLSPLPPLAPGSSASLDRSLLRQQHEENLQKPNTTFRTLPRPKRIRQLHLPLVGAITRSSSSTDVTNKEARLHDHVASDTNDCTLTRMKKRLSQSFDTLVAAQRTSHFYENPYLMLSDDELPVSSVAMDDHEGLEGMFGDSVAPQYASVPSCIGSQEDLPRDKEHLYARISTYMDTSEGNLNRHSYASVHYSGGKLPSPILHRSPSRHTYISVIFGSADALSKSSQAPPAKPARSTHRKSRSCSDLASVRPPPVPAGGLRSTPENEPTKNHYVNVAAVSENCGEFPRVQFSRPHSSVAFATTDGNLSDGMDGIHNGGFRQSTTTSPDLSSPSGGYQNVNEALDLGPSLVQSPTLDCSASTPCNGSNEVVHPILNGTKDDRLLSPSVGTKGRYENVNEALDSSSVSPIHYSARSPSSGTSGVVHHHIPNGHKAGTKGRYDNVDEALETSRVSPIHDDPGHTHYNGTPTAVHGVPNSRDDQELGKPLRETKIDYENLTEILDASFRESLTKDSTTSSTSDGLFSVAHHPYENITTVIGDSSYLADNSGSEWEDSLVFSEPNSSVFHRSTTTTRNSESSDFNESYYGVPKTSVRPLERFNGTLDEPFTSDDGETIEVYEKRNRVAGNSLAAERRQPKTLSTYLEGRLEKGQEVREETGNLGTETKIGNFDEDEHTYENFISNKRQSCGSDVSSSSRDQLSSTSSQLSIEEKESESQPLISYGRGKGADRSDLNGNSVCDRFEEKSELRIDSGNFLGNHLSGESLA